MEKKIIINIGRQFGSGGKCVAEILGKKLGIPVYDNEIITKSAQDSGFSEELFQQSDEKRRAFSLSSFLTGSYSVEAENYMSDKGLFKIQSETIRRIADQGSAIIVGRCSDYILRESGYCLNVFLTSPFDIRVERIMERMNLDRDQAASLIESRDKAREEYYNYYTFGNWGVADTYHICLDSSVLGFEETADFIIDFAGKSGLLP